MSDQPMGDWLDYDWPETTHEFVKGPAEDNERMTDERLTWYICNRCGGRKLIKTEPANLTGPETRYIQMTVPDGMAQDCKEKI